MKHLSRSIASQFQKYFNIGKNKIVQRVGKQNSNYRFAEEKDSQKIGNNDSSKKSIHRKKRFLEKLN